MLKPLLGKDRAIMIEVGVTDKYGRFWGIMPDAGYCKTVLGLGFDQDASERGHYSAQAGTVYDLLMSGF